MFRPDKPRQEGKTLHDLGFAHDCADRHSSADHFAQSYQVRLDTDCLPVSSKTKAKTGYHLVKDEQGSELSVISRRNSRNSARWTRSPLLAGKGSMMTAAIRSPCCLKSDSTASSSSNGATRVARAISAGTPAELAIHRSQAPNLLSPAFRHNGRDILLQISLDSRPVTPRAMRKAVITASVPELMIRTRSKPLNPERMSSAISTSRLWQAP